MSLIEIQIQFKIFVYALYYFFKSFCYLSPRIADVYFLALKETYWLKMG